MTSARALINNEMDKLEKSFSNFFEHEDDLLKDLKNFIQGPSKRIRSVLCLLYLKANNVKVTNDFFNVISAGELIHNASLLHDDVIDESELRRNNITIYKKYSPKISILSGDYILSIAVKQLLKIKNFAILKLFLNATEEMSNAELNQYLNRNKPIDIQKYLEIIDGKTASLFQAILESTSILANLETKQAITLGKYFGRLFQINNDTQQNSIANDKKNGITTIVDILGIEKARDLKDNYKNEIKKILESLPNKKYSNGIEDLIKLL